MSNFYLHRLITGLVFLAYQGLEFWLGKNTDLGSVWGAIGSSVGKLLAKKGTQK